MIVKYSVTSLPRLDRSFVKDITLHLRVSKRDIMDLKHGKRVIVLRDGKLRIDFPNMRGEK